MPIAVPLIIPTTGGPAHVDTFERTPELAQSVVHASGDWVRPEWFSDYHAMLAEGGPVRHFLADGKRNQFRLVLSRLFDHGRSWVLPVFLAHWLDKTGAKFVESAREADLVIVASGELQFDFKRDLMSQVIAAKDYHIQSKIQASSALMTEMSEADVPTIFLLPPDPDRSTAVAALKEYGEIQAVPCDTFQDVADAISHMAGDDFEATLPALAIIGREPGGKPIPEASNFGHLLRAGILATIAVVAMTGALLTWTLVGVADRQVGTVQLSSSTSEPGVSDQLPNTGAADVLAIEILAFHQTETVSCVRFAAGEAPAENMTRIERSDDATFDLRANRLCAIEFRSTRGERLVLDETLRSRAYRVEQIDAAESSGSMIRLHFRARAFDGLELVRLLVQADEQTPRVLRFAFIDPGPMPDHTE